MLANGDFFWCARRARGRLSAPPLFKGGGGRLRQINRDTAAYAPNEDERAQWPVGCWQMWLINGGPS